MAEKFVEIIQPDIGRELCLVEGNNGKYLGYKKDILVENLSERENTMFVCIRCQGIMREVCLSSAGEQFCSSCKKENEQANPNLQMDDMILSFQCSCPLITRGCKWLGVLGGCQNHLDTCGYVYETCEIGCRVVLQRNELSIHEMEKCPQRLVECEHCNNEFKSCEFRTHLDKCPKMEVSCELNCGKIMCREDMTQHLKQDCVEEVIMCPYAKYKCEFASIKRKYLSQHLEEKRTEHLELKLNAMEEIAVKQNAIELKLNAMEELTMKQNETIEKLNRTITELSREKEKSLRRIENLEKESKSTLGIASNIPLNLRPSSKEKTSSNTILFKRKSKKEPKSIPPLIFQPHAVPAILNPPLYPPLYPQLYPPATEHACLKINNKNY